MVVWYDPLVQCEPLVRCDAVIVNNLVTKCSWGAYCYPDQQDGSVAGWDMGRWMARGSGVSGGPAVVP